MKKVGLALFALVLLTTLSVKCDNCDKIIIDHKGKIIQISENAWEAHQAHGDELLWECED